MMNATIKDIASKTGLSTATISKYLNHKKIREENRILIEEAIRQLDYKPNRAAQLLRSKHTKTVGILISDLGNYFWGALVSSVTHFFMEYDYMVIIRSFYFDAKAEAGVIQDLITQNVDGVIMLPFNEADSMYHLLQEAGIPVVLLDHLPLSMEHYPIDCILSDNYKGSERLARYLLEKGHRRIYALERSVHSYTIRKRIQGVSDVFARKGCVLSLPSEDYEPIPFTETDYVMEAGRKRFLEVMGLPQPPTAVFFTNYLVAMGGLMAAFEIGIKIPEDVSLVCFDDDVLFKAMRPSLTCVAQNLDLIGTNACELLLRRIQGDYSDFPSVISTEVDFQERTSVKDLNAPSSGSAENPAP